MDDFAIVNMPVTGATIDFVGPTGFGTPKGAILYWSKTTANGTPVNGALMGIGFTDGTNHRSLGVFAEHNVSPSNVADMAGGRLLTFPSETGSYGDDTSGNGGYLSFNSWITDGLRATVTVTPGAAYRVTCVLLGGDVSNVLVGDGTVPTTIDTATNVALAFIPTFFFCASRDATAINTTRDTAKCALNLGIGTPLGSEPPAQHSLGFYQADALNPSQVRAKGQSLRVGGEVFNGRQIQFRDFNGSNYNAYLRDGGGGGGLAHVYMHVKMGTRRAKLQQGDSPTASGNHTMTSVGWKPQIGFMISSSVSAWDTEKTDAEAESFGFSAFMEANAYASCVSMRDNVATTVTDSNTDNDSSVHIRQNGSSMLAGGKPTFNTDGGVINYTTASVGGTARKRVLLFVEGAAPPDAFTKLEIRAAP